ncbi:MAG: glycosyltransferase family protein [Gemmatimonadales bacterium]
MTQALAVHQILSRSGHEVVGVVAGRSSHRALPDYVTRALPVPVARLDSPGFALRDGRAVDMAATAWRTVVGYRRWAASIGGLRALIEETRPDLIINFFEPLTGLLQLTRPARVPVVSVAHQHMIGHSAHRAPLGERADQLGLQLFATMVGCRSWKLALSFYPAADLPRHRTLIGPPILRRELFDLEPTEGGYFLVYLVNHGYHEEIRAWHRANPGTTLHCFYDRPGAPEVEDVGGGLTFHSLDGEKFLRLMAGCRAVVSTAGFESISEAAWLGKPVYLVPVEHHAEQQWNARDAVQAGLGISDRRFDLDRLARIRDRPDTGWFREWVASAPAAIERVLDRALS